MSRIRFLNVLLAVLALAICTGTLGAATPTIAATPSSLALVCDTVNGPVPASVGISLVTAGSAAVNVTVTAPAGAPIVLPSPAVKAVGPTTAAVPFGFSVAAGCAGATNGQQVVLTFTPATGTGFTLTATITITSPTIAPTPATAGGIQLNCDTVLGPTPASVGIMLASAGSLNVTAGAAAASIYPTGPLVLPSPPTKSVTGTTAATAASFSFSLAPGCAGASVGTSTLPLTFTPSGAGSTDPITVIATLNVTNSGSALVISPNPVTITCTKSGTTYTPGAAQTVSVTSTSNAGTPFIIDTTGYPLPGWLAVTNTSGAAFSGGTAMPATAVQFKLAASSTCGGLPVGSTSFSLALKDAPGTEKFLPVTIQVGSAISPLSTSTTAVALTYTIDSNTYTPVSINIIDNAGVFFSVDTTTLPLWANVGTVNTSSVISGPASGTTGPSSPVALWFVPTAGALSLAPGTYSATVHLKVSGYLDYPLTVNLHVQNAASSLGISQATGSTPTLKASWTYGTATPTFLITPVSTDSPVSYGITTTAGTLNPIVTTSTGSVATSGLALSFGSSPLTVTFALSTFSSVQPGSADLTGAVILTPVGDTPGGTGSVTVNLDVKVLSPGASISGIAPSSLPTATAGTFNVTLTGSGFVSTGTGQITVVGVVVNNLIVVDPNITVTPINSTSIALSIQVPASTDPYLPFSGSGGSVIIGVCNPQGVTCSVPASSVTLTIGINPIVEAVTSASSYMQATPPNLMSISSFDVLSIFGTNFCVSGGTGCTSNAILYGATDPVNPSTLRYLTTLTPDSASPIRNVSVLFQTHDSSKTQIGYAPLLFATNNQINLVVPEAVNNYIGETVDVVVSFGYGQGSTLLQSVPYSVLVAAADPGIFTISGDGQGDAAALVGYNLISSPSNPANVRVTASDSDIVTLYVTGLGMPDSIGSGTGYSATCPAPDGYWQNVNTLTQVSPSLASDDGLVMQASMYPTGMTLPPCMLASDSITVSIGGSTSAQVQYAGWAPGAIAGLYQINVQLPTSVGLKNTSNTTIVWNGTAVEVPVVVTYNGASSQSTGVTLFLNRTLKVTYTGLKTGTAGAAWTQNSGGVVVADGTTGGNTTYGYSASGLPDGITIDPATGILSAATGLASDAVSGTATITVAEKVSGSATGVTGSVTVSFTIAPAG